MMELLDAGDDCIRLVWDACHAHTTLPREAYEEGTSEPEFVWCSTCGTLREGPGSPRAGARRGPRWPPRRRR